MIAPEGCTNRVLPKEPPVAEEERERSLDCFMKLPDGTGSAFRGVVEYRLFGLVERR